MSKEDQMINELKKIRELLESKPTPASPPKPKGMMNEFKDFIVQYKVMGMAVAFIFALYLGAVVQSLVKDLVLPIIGLAVPGLGNLSTLVITVMNQQFGIGNFIANVITFLVVAFVIFIIVKITKRIGID